MDLKAWAEAQKAVIGSMLLAPDLTTGEIFQKARPKHFGDPALRHIFEAARELWDQNRKIDPVTLQAAAGDDYSGTIRDCMLMTPSSVNISEWLSICQSSARLQAMQAEAMAILNAATETEAVEAYERIGQELQGTGSVEVMTITELISSYLDRMQDRTPTDYLHWGIDSLDKTLYVSKGQFVVIAADSSSGKTAIALQFAYHMASKGKRVGFISLETPWESLGSRLMAERQVAGIALPVTMKKALSEDDYRRAADAGIRSDGMYFCLVRNCFTLQEIRSVILQHRLDVVFIDYVQLISAPGRERWDIVTNIAMSLHRMAQQLGTVVIGLSQITPQAKGSKQAPTKDDLRESRQLKQDADAILMLYPDTADDAPKNGRILEIAKHKDGRLARLKLNFEPEYMTFSYRSPGVDEMRAQGRAKKNQKYNNAGEDVGELPD